MRKGVFAFSADYQRRINAIFDWTYPYDDNGTVLLSMTNFDKPLDIVDAYLGLNLYSRHKLTTAHGDYQ